MKTPAMRDTRRSAHANCWSMPVNCANSRARRCRKAIPWSLRACISSAARSNARLRWPKANKAGTNARPNAAAPQTKKPARPLRDRENNSQTLLMTIGAEPAIMDTRLIAANPAEVDTECLVVFALDHSVKSQGGNSKEKPEPRLAVKDAALEKAVADLVGSGEVTGKAFETAMLHRPQGLKAKRLLVVGAGKAKSFSHAEVRKAAGSAIRALKPKT